MKFLFFFFGIITAPLISQEQIANANGIEICYETFGNQEDPALLLIMGGCCQGILWPDAFCYRLSEEGFYVIRYDHRDAGLSTYFDYQISPYDLFDMAKDGIGLLDFLGLKKVHLLGLSMGGPIAELMSVFFPKHIATVTLMATSPDFRPFNLACNGQKKETNALSPPSEEYIKTLDEFLHHPPHSWAEQLEQRIAFWHLLNGSIFPLEDQPLRSMHERFLSRLRYPAGMSNHVKAILCSEKLIKEIPYQVCHPTLIIQGSEDPIFPKDHGESLAEIIPNSTYILVNGMGHLPNPHFYELLIQKFKQHVLKNKLI